MKVIRSLVIIIWVCFFWLGIAFSTDIQNNNIISTDTPIVILDTSQGRIEIELMPDVAPLACANFIGLVNRGYYNGLIFHRVIKNFMIQGGDPTGTGRGGVSFWGHPFEDEVRPHITFDSPGILAMANAGPSTNGSQFFITTAPAPWLNMHHTIFGRVRSGFHVVEAIENVATDMQDKPLQEQKIVQAYVKE